MEQKLAEKFKMHVPAGYGGRGRRVLYIGKATAGDLKADETEWVFDNKNTPFWKFADRINDEVAGGNNRSNIAWTNIFKQGVLSGNPTREIAASQREASMEELREDLKETNANLIVLVTVGYEEEIVKAAFNISNGESVEVEDGKLNKHDVAGQRYDIWSRPAFQGIPPIVWLNHPQFKDKAYLDAAIECMKDVTGW